MGRVGSTGCSDSWGPVCAVRDKPEKQNLVHSGRDLVPSGRRRGENCFQASIHVKFAMHFLLQQCL